MRLTLAAVLLLAAAGCDRREDAPAEEPVTGEAVEQAVMVTDGHSSRDSLDWAGTYAGVVPCASCPGIETEVTLNGDGTYRLSRLYIDEAPAPLVSTGSFAWDAAGARITLESADDVQRFQVGENVLFQLDRNGARIAGDLAGRYVLRKRTTP